MKLFDTLNQSVATRPLAMITPDDTYFYTHDANKKITYGKLRSFGG